MSGSEDTSRRLRRLARDPKDDHEEHVVAARRADLAEQTGVALTYVGGASPPTISAKSQIEGMVGFVKVPLGIAGPLLLSGEFDTEVFVPFASTEGTMVASFSRGMKILGMAGGVRAWVVEDGLTFNPAFTYASVVDALAAKAWIEEHAELLRRVADETTRHGRLLTMKPVLAGREVILRCRFHTAEAHGINLVVRAVDAMRRAVAAATKMERPYFDEALEKRESAYDLLEGRGKHVVAEAVIPAKIVGEHLRTTPAAMAMGLDRFKAGLERVGTSSFHGQAHNAIVAVYLACGQDVGYAIEAGAGQLEFRVASNGDLHIVGDYPAMVVGTFGGGTRTGTAAECLDLMSCNGPGSARRFACILAGACLAGELSFFGSILAGEFVESHDRLGRPGAK
jgi:hydroxymethylglutaryl-CoA reductase (NADPH)